MKKIKVQVDWCGGNYAAVASDDTIGGSVLSANKKLDALKCDFAEAMDFHIAGLEPQIEYDARALAALADGYELEFELSARALLKYCTDGKTTLTAISRASGIDVRQLSLYSLGGKTPRTAQRTKILSGIRRIAGELTEAV